MTVTFISDIPSFFAHVTRASGTSAFKHQLFVRSSQTAGGYIEHKHAGFPTNIGIQGVDTVWGSMLA